MDSSHSCVSVGSMSSNGDCWVISKPCKKETRPCTHPRVLLRWHERYSVAARTAAIFTPNWLHRIGCPSRLSAHYLRGLFLHGQGTGTARIARKIRAAGVRRTSSLHPAVQMPIRLPFEKLTVPVREIRARISTSTLARHAGAIVFVPLKPAAGDWTALPHGEMLRELHARKIRKEGDCCQLRVGPGAETLLVMVCPAAQASTFERLQSAAKIARAVLDGEPATLLIWERGCDPQTVAPALHAALAAIQAAAFRFATFKSRPKPRTLLGRIDLALAGGLEDLETTLATSAGNNLARWLTALPPSTLNAATYRRLLQELARRLKLSYRF